VVRGGPARLPGGRDGAATCADSFAHEFELGDGRAHLLTGPVRHSSGRSSTQDIVPQRQARAPPRRRSTALPPGSRNAEAGAAGLLRLIPIG
jgi:hypothetical protein